MKPLVRRYPRAAPYVAGTLAAVLSLVLGVAFQRSAASIVVEVLVFAALMFVVVRERRPDRSAD